MLLKNCFLYFYSPIIQQLKQTYEPVATNLSAKIVSFVDEAAEEAIDTRWFITYSLTYMSS